MRHPEKIKRTCKDSDTGKVVTYTRYQVRIPQPGGGKAYHLFSTLAEANAFAAEQETARRGGLVVNTRVKFDDELLKEFGTSHCGALLPGSRHDYSAALRRALPYFAAKPLRSITPKQLEDFRDKELLAIRDRQRAVTAQALIRAERKLSRLRSMKLDTERASARIAELRSRATAVERGGTKAVNKTLGALRTFLKWAQARGYVAQNVAQHVKKLKPMTLSDVPMEETVLGPAELQRLIAATAPEWRVGMQLLAYGGLRIGEMLGVSWDDVELDAGRVLVRRQLAGDTGTLRETKTKAGRRFVPLRPAMTLELKRWKLACPKGPFNLVNPNSEGAPMNHFNWRARVFRPALRRAGLRRVRVHDLRHSCASLWLAAGVDIAEVSRALGHASPLITMSVYAHWIQRRQSNSLAAMAEAFLVAEEQDGCEMVAAPSARSRNRTQVVEEIGGPCRDRTYDQEIKSLLLYQLS